MNKTRKMCPICDSYTHYIGSKYVNQSFRFKRCNFCNFIFIENFRSDFSNIYNEAYYLGKGFDSNVRYIQQLKMGDKSIKNYEYEGILKIIKKLLPGEKKCLDFGCGTGGLVRFLKNHGIDALGYDDGFAFEYTRSAEIPIINKTELDSLESTFDFISAIEVLEHIPNPLETFNTFRRLLKPGGVLFITTGNSEPFRNSIFKWHYTKVPAVHISFYEPSTLKYILEKTGFSYGNLKLNEGYSEILKYKILNYLGFNKKKMIFDFIPFEIITKLINERYKLTDQPYGILK